MRLHDSCTVSCQVRFCKNLATDLAQVLPVSYEGVPTLNYEFSEIVTRESCQGSYPRPAGFLLGRSDFELRIQRDCHA